MGWNPFRDSWRDWDRDPSRRGSDRHEAERAGLEDWRRTHSIDPMTGDLIGTPGLIPAELGLEYQLLHEQGRDRARQNRMRSAANYARGALGLLQSFRPGGGATLEAGQYNALANIEIQRAQMLQPLDLMGDYRRHESALASQRSNRARATSTIVQVAALAVSALTGGAAGAAVGGLLGVAGSLFGGGGGGTQTADAMNAEVYRTNPDIYMSRTGGTPGADPRLGAGPLSGEQQQLRQEERGLGVQQLGYEQPEGRDKQGMQQRMPGAGQPGQPGQEPQAGAGPGGPGAGGGGFAAGGGGAVGSDGNFEPVAYAANAAGTMVDPLQGTLMSLSLAQRLDEDPAWSQLSFAIDQRLRARVRGAA